jgi:uncharacterized protein
MKKVILDTNFLLIPGLFKVDIFTEIRNLAHFNYELFIIDKTIDELKKIIDNQFSKSYDKLNAKIGLQLIKQKKIKKIKSDCYVDDAILKIADENTVVATSDKELKKKLREKEIKLILLKQKQYLVME